MELLRLISAPEVVAQIISFLVLLFILRAFAWKKFLGVLDQRKERILQEFNRLESAKAEVEKLKRDYEEKLSRIDETARQKTQEAEDSGRLLFQEIKEEAHKQAQQLLEKGKEGIQIELAKARHQLIEEIVDLTLRATENLIQEKLTSGEDRKIVEDFLQKIDEAA